MTQIAQNFQKYRFTNKKPDTPEEGGSAALCVTSMLVTQRGFSLYLRVEDNPSAILGRLRPPKLPRKVITFLGLPDRSYGGQCSYQML